MNVFILHYLVYIRYLCTKLANSNLVPYAPANTRATTLSPDTVSQPVDHAISTQPQTPTSCETERSYLSCIRNKLQVKGFSPDTIELILSSWRDRTKYQYQSAAKKWFEFCESNNCDMFSPPVPLALSFFQLYINPGCLTVLSIQHEVYFHLFFHGMITK